MSEIKTYNDLYLGLRRELKAAGIEDFNLEARMILAEAGGKTKEELVRDMKLYALGTVEDKANEMARRRIAGEPMAYVLGEWEFMGKRMMVAPGVLVPRPDTETLAELAIKLLRSRDTSGARVLDLCCGTGCIGISVASEVADTRVVLVDNSMKALRVARENVRLNNVSRNTTVIEADAMEKPPMLLGRFDIIACNPPYIPTGEISTLDKTVKDYEPREALDGGKDGLSFYRAIIPEWSQILRDHGLMLFECGEGQSRTIGKMMTDCGFKAVAYYKDAAGTERVVAGAI